VPIQCVYTDLDGTLLGRGASLFRDAAGDFTMLAARALEACHRARVEVVIKSGRRRETVNEDARLLGQSAYIYELGSGLVIDGEQILLTGELKPRDGKTVYELIDESGAPKLLLDTYSGLLEYHSPWHGGREVTHLLRGLVDEREANELLEASGHGQLRLVDNGAISPKRSLPNLPGPPHAYHLLPRQASKARAVAAHIRARGYEPGECVGVGDSREDLDVAGVVGRFFLVANALEKDPSLAEAMAGRRNVEVTEGSYGEGFYEAVVRSMAESRSV
jgi:hydroxymethylpyrimidine pyrophosphatase-like HAD family hydrolase